MIRFISLLFLVGILFGCHDNTTEKDVTDTEQFRPNFHFTPKSGWMNDPNGMYYYKGLYHLSYQYYPDSIVWGPMHWGHATSKDLIHWKHEPVILYPDSLGLIFSGGAVVDHKNTTGFGSIEKPPIVAAFTHHNMQGEKEKRTDFQFQSIAFSTDEGQTWKKYQGNPVIPNTNKIKDFRDPKVVWHEPSSSWILVLAVYDRVHFYGSKDLKTWNFLSEFGIDGDQRLWECPDLFPMKVQETDEEKWVLIVSIQKEAPNGGTATSYFVGDFDGTAFQADIETQKWLDWGPDNYAFVTWDNVPDKRRIGIGWMSNWQYAQVVPASTWRSSMTLPRELTLTQIGSDYQLLSNPVKESENLYSDFFGESPRGLTFNDHSKSYEQLESYKAVYNFNLKETDSQKFGFTLKNDLNERVNIIFDRANHQLIVDRTQSSKNKFSKEFFARPHTAPLDFSKDSLDVTIFFDRTSLEIFANKGALNFTQIFFPQKPFNELITSSLDGKNVVFNEGYFFDLKTNKNADF